MTFIATTPEDIEYVRLASMKGKIKLEKVGMKSRGGSVRRIMALEMKLRPMADYDAVIAAIEAKMKELLEKKQNETHKA